MLARLWITLQSREEDKIAPMEEGRGDIYFKPISPTVAQSLKPNGRAVRLSVPVDKGGKSKQAVQPPAG